MSPLAIQDYHVGWICAVYVEMTAAISMLDEEHEMVAEQHPQDHNSYALGRIHQHNVVIASLPDGEYGLVPAATTAKDMVRTFTALRIVLMVGIGGGIPDLSQGIDIRLGDVVVSKPDRTWGGVVQYDKGKAEDGGKFVVKGHLNQPPALLLRTLAQLRARRPTRPSKMSSYMTDAITRNPAMEEDGFTFPIESDCLHCSVCQDNIERPSPTCTGLHAERKRRPNYNPVIHYGVIASGNQVVKDAQVRDQLRDAFNALCVEMEGAGLMNEFPCLVIRGICDYADRHKNDAWQPYAAMTAAGYAKELLGYISPAQATKEGRIQDGAGNLTDHLNVSKEILKATKRRAAREESHYQDENDKRCHQTFKTSTYEDFKNFNPDRVDGTCQWVLSNPRYHQWRTSDRDDLLWISADPGCGKSVLARSLIDNELKRTERHTICYFFFKDHEPQNNVATALCAVLHQLFTDQPWLIQHAVPVWQRNNEEIQKERLELWRIFLAATRAPGTHDVTCVFDALDECRSRDQEWLLDILSRFHTEMLPSESTKRRGRLKILVTSRPYHEIQVGFRSISEHFPSIRLKGEDQNVLISQEINLVIRKRVEEMAKDLKLDSRVRALEDIRESFEASPRPEDVSIESVPSSVDHAYEKILGRITERCKGTVQKVLQIILAARRPLAVPEMAIALGIATATQHTSLEKVQLDVEWLQNSICQWCGLFVYISNARIYLIHQTAKEFLICASNTTLPQTGWKHSFKVSDAEQLMSHICAGHWSFETTKSRAKSIPLTSPGTTGWWHYLNVNNQVESFMAYTARYWPSHHQEALVPVTELSTGKMCEIYNVHGDVFEAWFRAFWKVTRPSKPQPQMNPIRLSALLGDFDVLNLLLQSNEIDEIDASDEYGQTALKWACKNGDEMAVQILLDRGADVNIERGEYGTALHTAAEGGYDKILQMLVKGGADVNIRGKKCGSALYVASRCGHHKVVQILVQEGADVNFNGEFESALYIAAERGHEKVVKVLIDGGADVNAHKGSESPFYVAVKHGREKVVQLLIEADADIDVQGEPNSSLYAAAERGHEMIVQLLIEGGAVVDAHGGLDGALYVATKHGFEKVVQVLIEGGADVNAHGESKSALYIAVEYGFEKVVQRLIEGGADVEAQGEFGSPLFEASANGHEKIVEILLDNGADVNAKGVGCVTAFQAATDNKHAAVARLLLQRGADVDYQAYRFEMFSDKLARMYAAGGWIYLRRASHREAWTPRS